jgi:geranylgeranyl diphosphate synthase type 3
LIDAFNHWLQIDSTELQKIKEIIEMLHTASLLIDDIEDASHLRRGIPTAHLIYGIPITINTANYVYFLALQLILDLHHPQAISIFTDEMIRLHQGQGMELYFREHCKCPTMEEYDQIIKNSKLNRTFFFLLFHLFSSLHRNRWFI